MKKTKLKGTAAQKAMEWVNEEAFRNINDMLERDGLYVDVNAKRFGFSSKTEMICCLDGRDCLINRLYVYEEGVQNHPMRWYGCTVHCKKGSRKVRAFDSEYTLTRKTAYMKIVLHVIPEFRENNQSYYNILTKVILVSDTLLERFDEFALSELCDMVGHPIKVGDCVVYSSAMNSSLEVGVVKKLGDVMFTVDGGVRVHSQKSFVVQSDDFVKKYLAS